MKSERRHELTTNALADWLGEIIQWIRPYQTTVLGVVLLAALLVMLLILLFQRWTGQTAEAWEQFYSQNPALWAKLAEEQPTTPVGGTAGVVSGDLCLRAGTEQRFVNDATANQKLANAVEFYERVQKSSPSPQLREQATFGLARTLETQGKLDDARTQYKKLRKQWPDGAFADYAAKRLEDLQRPATKEFYDQFAHFNPKPSYTEETELPTKAGLSQPDSLSEPTDQPTLKGNSPFKSVEEDKGSSAAKPPEPVKPSPPKPSPAETKK